MSLTLTGAGPAVPGGGGVLVIDDSYALVFPSTFGASFNGSASDFNAVGQECWALQQVGEFDSDGSLAGKLQESANGSTEWTDVAGAAFPAVAASEQLAVVSFTPTKRYVRYVATMTGTVTGISLSVTGGTYS